jgi:hypothetical protein
MLFGTRPAYGACAPSPLAGEGRDGGEGSPTACTHPSALTLPLSRSERGLARRR